MSDRNRDQTKEDSLKPHFKGMREKLCASPRLKAALKTGTPLHRAGIRYTPATHIRRFSKAIIAYAAGVLLFLGAVMMLPKLWKSDPVNSPGMNVTTKEQQKDMTIEQEILAAYAELKQVDVEHLVLRFITEFDGTYAVIIRDTRIKATVIYAPEIVHFYPFYYSGGNSIQVYKDGRFYTLTQAYELHLLTPENVLELYLMHAEREGYLNERKPEKYYYDIDNVNIDWPFYDNSLSIKVFAEYDSYPYTVSDFSEIDCIEIHVSPTPHYIDGTPYKTIILTLDQNSKQHVLDCLKILIARVDVCSASVSSYEFPE